MTGSAVSLGHTPTTRWVRHEVYRRVIGGEQWMLACIDGLSSLISAWSPAVRDVLRILSILKTWCDEARYRAADTAIQVHGGSGLLTEIGIERIFRVARNLRIPAGTTEIPRELIARSL